MARHRRDLLSLLSGLCFLLVGGLYLLENAAGVGLDLHVLVPALLIGIGAVGLLGSLRRPTDIGSRGSDYGPAAERPTPQE